MIYHFKSSYMTEDIRSKLEKIYELVNWGATEGERAAAKKALDRIIDKHNITEDELDSINLKNYVFKYATNIEMHLLGAILLVLVTDGLKNSSRGNKRVNSKLNYMDWITVESAYEYFRRHMKKEWNWVCVPELNKCRKPKTRREKRAKIEEIFLTEYLVKSKLYKEEYLSSVEVKNNAEYEARLLMMNVEGGQYNRQLNRGLLLSDAD